MKTIPPTVLSALFVFAGILPAQPPKGHLIVSAFNPGTRVLMNRNGLPGGLFFEHPRIPGQTITVQGLPLQMTGRNILGSSFSVGCSGVAVLPGGDLLVGEVTPPSGSMNGVNNLLEVHRVRIKPGTWSGQVTKSWVLATIGPSSGFGAEVTDIELLPSGMALVAYYTGWAPHLVLLDPKSTPGQPGATTAVSVTGFPSGSLINALATSADGQTAYLGEQSSGGIDNIWTLPLSNPRPVATQLTFSSAIGSVNGIDRDNQGDLVVGKRGQLWLVNALTGAIVLPFPSLTGVNNVVLVERNTGDWFTGGPMYYVPQGGTPVRLYTGGQPFGIAAGFAMLPAVDSFGRQSTCASTGSYEWQTAPNPGGIPLVGNAGFSLTMQAPGPQPVSLFAFSFAPAAAPLPLPSCAQLWLAPGSLFANLIVGSTLASPSTFTLPLGIPNSPGLAGLSLFAQSFHLPGATPPPIESSAGLCITIL